MARVKKTVSRRRRSAPKKGWFAANLKRILTFLFLLAFLTISLVTVSYVIFFRTVFAQQILTSEDIDIIFEEPNPPEHEDSFEIPATEPRHEDNITDEQADILPKVAIIIDDMGYHEDLGRRLVDLPIEMTYSILPYAPYSKQLEQYAHYQNKTILLHLPLEPRDNHWHPGAGALYLEDPPEIQLEKLEACLEKTQYAVGVNNHMGSRFSADEPAMRRILEHLKERSLIFIDSYTTAESVGLTIARELGIKSSRRHVFLDNILDTTVICNELSKLVDYAEKYGAAVGIGHPHEVTYEAIMQCSSQYLDRIEYVGATDVVQ